MRLGRANKTKPRESGVFSFGAYTYYAIAFGDGLRKKVLLDKETKMTVPTILDYLIGFDPELHNSRWKNTETKYPPFDVYQNDDGTILEFALAGYSKDDIEVSVENSTLKISARKEKKTETEKYTHKGIAVRSFEKKFALSEYAVVNKAEFKDGILRIVINMIIPEEKKPRKIEIL